MSRDVVAPSPSPSAPGARLVPGVLVLLFLAPVLSRTPASGPDSLLPGAAAQNALAAQEMSAQSRNRVARAVRADSGIVVDGRLDESDWERAEVITGFTQVEPDEGEPAEEPTEVRILYDDENIYLGAKMFDSDTSRIAHQLTRRDQTGRAAGYFEFSFDSNFDRTTGYTFRVTAAGVQRDEYMFDDTEDERAWNGVWESEVSFTDDGWVAEIRLPLSQVRYEPSAEPQVWGVNFARRRIAANERSEWAFVPIGTSGEVSRWGRLEGMVLDQQNRYAEVLPYAMSGLEWAPARADDPFFDGTDGSGQLGADLRYGLGSTFVVDATVNPDFGQVEVDPRVINLSAFETFFPERRPFFTRDSRIFEFDLAGRRTTLFHSRRIGRSPQGDEPAGAAFSTAPSETTILGAAKVTGRTAGGLSVGALTAVTDRERGRAFFPERPPDERFEAYTVEPRTFYGTLRLEQDFREGQSRLGAMTTAVERGLPADGGRLGFLPEQAYTGGIDFEHTWSDREWAVEGYLAGSLVRGGPDAMLALQTSSNHFFQRPDQDYMELDSAATSLSGAEWQLQIGRRSGRHWTGDLWLGQRTPGFEINDVGFATGTETLDLGGRLEYQQPVPGDVFRRWEVSFFGFQNWRNSVLHDGVFSADAWGRAHKDGQLQIGAEGQLLNWWEIGVELEYEPETVSDVLTRGGPLMVDPGMRTLELSASTDRRDDVTVGAEVEYGSGTRGGDRLEVGFGVEARPTNGIVFSLNPTYERTLNPRQYVTTVEEGDFEPTYGDRYVFADLHRQELSLDTRLNVIFTPDLSFELFAQPLLSVGDYRTFKQLARPQSFDFLPWEGEAEESFNIRSLRGNAVLRWEYMPGSRIYLVWQQDRRGVGPPGSFDLTRDGAALLDAPGEHRFMIKVDHWIDL